ncbi:MAG: NAD-dependent epimerase/dehydratase family protein [Crocinitomix sp.]|nr:NAD-dependent epimerase/dehydratase family protein [Crocinitomix sp.]
MKVLVTGADGVLGSNLVRILLERNYEVTALIEKGKDPITLNCLDVNKVEGNILNIADVNAVMQGQDVLIHCAASTNVWPARSEIVNQVNVQGTENMIEACLRFKIKKMIYVGTANSFGFGSMAQPGKEGDEYKSAKYGLDYMDSKKLAQEKVMLAVKHNGLPAVVVNPTFMIGPYDSKPSSGAMILALINNKIPCYTKGGKNYINVADAAVGIANAITLGTIGECYILGNENLTFKAMFDKISAVVKCKAPKRKLPAGIVKLYGKLNTLFARLFRFQPSITRELAIISCEEHYYSAQKAVRELKLPQTPLEQGIKDCYEWFKANGYINRK